jgi:4-coumarate--CoA ligase
VVAPANPAYNLRELVHHLKDSGARGLVTQKELLKVALEAAREVGLKQERVVLIGEEAAGEQRVRHFKGILGEARRERERVKKDDLAFLVYSSGTTGYVLFCTHENLEYGFSKT